MENEYFNVDNIYLASAINFATKERFYKYINTEGKEVYSFPYKDSVIETYKELLRLRRKFN